MINPYSTDYTVFNIVFYSNFVVFITLALLLARPITETLSSVYFICLTFVSLF